MNENQRNTSKSISESICLEQVFTYVSKDDFIWNNFSFTVPTKLPPMLKKKLSLNNSMAREKGVREYNSYTTYMKRSPNFPMNTQRKKFSLHFNILTQSSFDLSDNQDDQHAPNSKLFIENMKIDTNRLMYVVIRRKVGGQSKYILKRYSVELIIKMRERASVLLQAVWRGHKTREKFQKIKTSVLLIQEKFRAYRAMRSQRDSYQSLVKNTIFIQTKFRANRLMKSERQKYSLLKRSTILIQQRLRAYLAMKVERTNYLNLKSSAVLIQQKFRAYKAMKEEREKYESIKKAVTNIQRRFRANKAVKIEKEKYEKLKLFVVLIQKKFRANKVMKSQRDYYQSLVKSTLFIQTKFRANKLMKIDKENYQLLKSSVILIQRKFRSNLVMKLEANQKTLKSSATFALFTFMLIIEIMKILWPRLF